MKIIYHGIREEIEAIISGRNEDRVREAIEKLPEIQREIIYAHFYDGMTQREIAKKLNRSTGFVHNRINNAKYKIRRQLNPSYYKRLDEIMYHRVTNF